MGGKAIKRKNLTYTFMTNIFKSKWLATTLAAGVLSAMAGSTALATPSVPADSLFISDGTSWIFITDNNVSMGNSSGTVTSLTGIADSNPASGGIVFLGTVGSFGLTVDTAQTYPVPGFGTSSTPKLDLSFTANPSAAGGSLTIAFTGTGYDLLNASFLSSIGGTNMTASGATVNFQAYLDSTDGNNHQSAGNLALLNTTGLTTLTNQSYTNIGTGVNFGGAGWSGVSNLTQPYSITEVVTITATTGGSVTGDAGLHAPDGGMTALLLGATFLGLAGLRRKLVPAGV